MSFHGFSFMHETTPKTTIRDITAVCCFFASGFVGLVYEICWIRKASLVFGATTFAVSTVVAVFFAGLSLGSYLFGGYSQKTSKPLKVYAFLEMILGGIALLHPALFSWAESLYGLFYPSVMHSFALLSFLRLVMLTVLILPPTLLMGATLPLFCRQYIDRRESISLSVGLLYGLNTLGAAAGCTLCGFYLIPHVGVNKTIWLGGLVNILIGIVVLRTGLTARLPQGAEGDPERPTGQKDLGPAGSPVVQGDNRKQAPAMYLLFFLSGFVALGNEILCLRFLSLLVHNTVYTYTLTLAVTLTGIVLGSVLIARFSDRSAQRPLIFGTAHVLNGLLFYGLLMMPAGFWSSVIDTQSLRVQLWIFTSVLLVPAILSGVSFPLAIRIVVSRPSLAGIGVGRMSAINTMGGILGSMAVGFLLLPGIGLQKSLLITSGLSLLIGFSAWLILEQRIRPVLLASMIVLAIFNWLAVSFLTGTRLPEDFLASREKLIDFREGVNAHLAVVRSKNDSKVLTIDRLWQGSSNKTHQIMAAHVPMLLHPEPRKVLIIGLGVGQTASRFLLYDVSRVDCVDIEGELYNIIGEHFESEWMQEDRVRLIVEDGRNFLAHTDETYDVVSIEVGQIFRPGLASFYTADFYERARKRLTANGMLCQFIPIRGFSTDTFRSVLRSFLEVFPESILWYNTSEFLLIGSAGSRPGISLERLRVLNESEAVRKDLDYMYWGGPAYRLNRPEVFLAGFLCGPEALSGLTSGFQVFRDDLPLLEYISSKRQSTESPKAVVDLVKRSLDPPEGILRGRGGEEILSQVRSIREMNLHNILAEYLLRGFEIRRDMELLRKAIRWNPRNIRVHLVLGKELEKEGREEEAMDQYRRALDLDPTNQEARDRLEGVQEKRKG